MDENNAFMSIKMEKQKHIALIAHDNKKQELMEWIKANKKVLGRHFLVGTGTTARLIGEEVGLPVRAFFSGPLGGDQQIGARIAEGGIDFVIFFWDPLEAQPHDPDVKALLRITVLYNVPIAMNTATADFLFASALMEQEYDRMLPDYTKKLAYNTRRFDEVVPEVNG